MRAAPAPPLSVVLSAAAAAVARDGAGAAPGGSGWACRAGNGECGPGPIPGLIRVPFCFKCCSAGWDCVLREPFL